MMTELNTSNRRLNSIFTAVNMLSTHYWQRQGRIPMEPDEFQKHLDEMHRQEDIFWDHQADDDAIRNDLNEIQNRLEEMTKPCFEEPMKTYGLLTKKWFNG